MKGWFQTKDKGHQRNCSSDQKGRKSRKGRLEGIGRIQCQPVFIGQHQSDPVGLVCRDFLGRLFQHLAAQSTPSQDLSKLLQLTAAMVNNMRLFDLLDAFSVVQFGLGPRIVAGRHRKPVRQNVCDTKDDDDLVRQTCPRNSGHDGKGGNRAINRTIDHVLEMAVSLAIPKAFGNVIGVMAVFF